MKKKFLLLLALLCSFIQGTWADTWDGETYTKPKFYSTGPVTNPDFFEGERQYTNVIFITSAAELAYVNRHFTEDVTFNGTTKAWAAYDYVLTTDIDMGDAVSWVSMGNDNDDPTAFTGTFDGVYYTIRIHTWGATTNYQGLFAKIGSGGKVVNLRVDGIVQCSTSRLVGGIAGDNDGAIEGCWVSADISSDWRQAMSAYEAKVGGIVGETDGTVSYCCVTGNVTNNDAAVGGLVGCNNFKGYVNHCTFYGTVSTTHEQFSTEIGENNHTFDDLYTEFTDKELTSYLNTIGDDDNRKLYREAVQYPFTITVNNGDMGSLVSDVQKTRAGKTVTLTRVSGDILSELTIKNADGGNLTFEGKLTDGYTFTMPQRDVVVNTQFVENLEGSGTQDSPYLVKNKDDWEKIHYMLKYDMSGTALDGVYFKQTNDISVTRSLGYNTVSEAAFAGNYDGDGHWLECDISANDAAAPFYRVCGATIENLQVKGTIDGGIHSAGLVAYVDRGVGPTTIKNCRVSADINCRGNDTNDAHGGGFVGHKGRSIISIQDCLFDGSLTAEGNSNDAYLGTFIGWGSDNSGMSMEMQIQDCVEYGTYNGVPAERTGYFWVGETSPSNASGVLLKGTNAATNVYVPESNSDITKCFTVTSGTEDLDIVFPDDIYTWETAYHDALFQCKHDNGTYYILGGQFYAGKGSDVTITVNYPETKVHLDTLSVNDEEITPEAGNYTFTQGDAPSVVTAVFTANTWISDIVCASEFSTVDGSTIHITNEKELGYLAKQVSGGVSFAGKEFVLDCDLDLSEYEWVPIGTATNPFQICEFDGGGHTISGVHTDHATECAGLFGYIAGRTSVKGIKLADSQITGTYRVGAIAGKVLGKVDDCYVGSDVTVTATAVEGDENSGTECGGVVGYVSYSDSSVDDDGEVHGCYSAATVSGVSRVGGIAGYLENGALEHSVSEAVVSGDSESAFIVGNFDSSSKAAFNYYIGETVSDNENDTRAFHVSLADDLKDNYEMTFTGEGEIYEYGCSGLTLPWNYEDRETYIRQFKMGDEWYGAENETFHFTIPEVYGGATVENVRVNDAEPSKDGDYFCFTVNSDAVVSGSQLLTLSNDDDNSEMIEKFNGKTVSVVLNGRILYKDNTWNTICLPFDVNISESVLEEAVVRTLERSDYDNTTHTLTLDFSAGNQETIEAGRPYIIKWEPDFDIYDPKFENVVISNAGTSVNTDFAYFTGSFSPVSLEADDKTVLYMGGSNTLYYPSADMTIGAFRAYFKLQNDLTADDLAQGAKSIMLNFGDGEATGISLTPDLSPKGEASGYYTLDGRRLSGKPSRKGVYINNGKKHILR